MLLSLLKHFSYQKFSHKGRLKRDVLKLLGRTKCPLYFVVTKPAPPTHLFFVFLFFKWQHQNVPLPPSITLTSILVHSRTKYCAARL